MSNISETRREQGERTVSSECDSCRVRFVSFFDKIYEILKIRLIIIEYFYCYPII